MSSESPATASAAASAALVKRKTEDSISPSSASRAAREGLTIGRPLESEFIACSKASKPSFRASL
eukprot:5298557-Pleurochrysis_carterae.AAC.1